MSGNELNVSVKAHEARLLIRLLKEKISERNSQLFNGKIWGHEIIEIPEMERLVARFTEISGETHA